MRVPFNEMKLEIKKVFLKYGLDDETADLCAQIHTESSRDGIYSHGTNRVARFVDYIKKGWVDVSAKPTLEKEFGAMAVVNGHMGPGIPNAFYSVNKAMQLAEKNGIGIVGLHNTTHWMRGGTYGLYAARKGFIAISWTNTESCMPPWGGKEDKLGNNPFVMAAPTDNNPVMIDMAMSQYAYGKLQVTRLAGKKLPFPGGFDEDGKLTVEPGPIEKSMRILPMGYWKGASFAFILDVLGAILSDGLTGSEIDSVGKGSCGGASQIFITIDPKRFTEKNRIYEIIEKEKKHIKSSALDEHSKSIWYPGEDYVLNTKENEEKGIFVDDSVWEEIKSL
ncbi:MAG: 3-dehydro-L-gulonate 2-dehydrogenase [Liquorilactobacillus nagelii]|jgi:3-dehydro-L-gulonate 2-dehydrogenase|uniref:3-dehydro-L-gulonate 2-dehydrogenase n=1 Tax=Liquorilactobacillus nagelii TaxID=82688 RepID=UPI0024329BC1|nr:3-dehydro-L-gulonate 2-dehydrogenase [Liquorilactobacillus nagelii]MCI1634108.1 3-dehydro-L-gulonate 2-dehydrogenase [Liquorilactobacillus nagelii]